MRAQDVMRVALAALAGCGELPADPPTPDASVGPFLGSSVGEGPRLDVPALGLEPIDGATRVDPSALAAVLQSYEATEAPPGPTAALRSGLMLRDAHGTPVDFDLALEDDVSTAGNLLTYLRVRPRSPLADGWYWLGTAPIDGVALANGWYHAGWSARAWGSRFRVGSEPRIHAVLWCKADSREAVVVSFSEPLDEARSALDAVSVEGCTLRAASDVMSFDCPLATSAAVRDVLLGDGLVARSGEPFVHEAPDFLVDGSGPTAGAAPIPGGFRVTFEDLPSLGGPLCRAFRPW